MRKNRIMVLLGTYLLNLQNGIWNAFTICTILDPGRFWDTNIIKYRPNNFVQKLYCKKYCFLQLDNPAIIVPRLSLCENMGKGILCLSIAWREILLRLNFCNQNSTINSLWHKVQSLVIVQIGLQKTIVKFL